MRNKFGKKNNIQHTDKHKYMKQVANERVGQSRKYVCPKPCFCVCPKEKKRKEEEKKNLFAGENENDPLCVCKGRTAVPDATTLSLSLAALQVPVDQSGTRGWWEREGTRKWVA